MSDNPWLIFGAGALGRLLAVHLNERLPIALVGRQASQRPLRATTPQGERRTHEVSRIMLGQAPAHPAVVHLTTKAYAAKSALDALAQHIPETTPVVLWQNGFQVQPSITRRWPGPVLCASTTEGAYMDASDGVVHAGHGQTYIGHLEGCHGPLADNIAANLSQSGLPTQACADIHQRLWHKLAVNAAINPLVARYRIRNGQLRDRPFRPMVDALIAELHAIMTKERITLPEGGWASWVWRVIENTANNRASMYQDVLAKRPTERDAILGPLLDAAQRHGLAVPALTKLYRDTPG